MAFNAGFGGAQGPDINAGFGGAQGPDMPGMNPGVAANGWNAPIQPGGAQAQHPNRVEGFGSFTTQTPTLTTSGAVRKPRSDHMAVLYNQIRKVCGEEQGRFMPQELTTKTIKDEHYLWLANLIARDQNPQLHAWVDQVNKNKNLSAWITDGGREPLDLSKMLSPDQLKELEDSVRRQPALSAISNLFKSPAHRAQDRVNVANLMQQPAGKALVEAISRSMGLGSNGGRVDPTKILETYIYTVARSSSNNALTLDPDKLFIINSARCPADLANFRGTLTREESEGRMTRETHDAYVAKVREKTDQLLRSGAAGPSAAPGLDERTGRVVDDAQAGIASGGAPTWRGAFPAGGGGGASSWTGTSAAAGGGASRPSAAFAGGEAYPPPPPRTAFSGGAGASHATPHFENLFARREDDAQYGWSFGVGDPGAAAGGRATPRQGSGMYDDAWMATGHGTSRPTRSMAQMMHVGASFMAGWQPQGANHAVSALRRGRSVTLPEARRRGTRRSRRGRSSRDTVRARHSGRPVLAPRVMSTCSIAWTCWTPASTCWRRLLS